MFRRLVPLIMAAAIVAGALPLNAGILEARMDNLNTQLARASADTGDVPASLAILVRFELVRRRGQLGESSLSNYELEARLMSLISGPQFGEQPRAKQCRARGPLYSAILALSRLIVGVEPYESTDSPWLEELERAFLFERTRRYSEAIEAYETLASNHDLETEIADTVELHRAFCLAMANRLADARSAASRLIADGAAGPVASVARRIASFVDYVDQERAALRETNLDQFDLGRSLYFAMDYEGAQFALTRFVSAGTGDQREAEARFYLGRSLEERGNPSLAIREYARVGLLDADGTWGREATRRVFLLASLYSADAELAADSRRQLARFHDTEFTDTVQLYSELASIADSRPDAGQQSKEPDLVPTVPDVAELFVRTEPSGAQVFIDHVSRGASPVFVDNLNPGSVLVEALSGELRAEAQLETRGGEITSVVLTLAVPFGTLRVDTPLTDVVVYLDETTALSLASPALERIAPGDYFVFVEGYDASGRLHIREIEVSIWPNRTTTVEFDP